jgi:hypothetical protein
VSIQNDSGLPIAMRQSKCCNTIVEQDHLAVRRIPRPMLGFKTFRCARILMVGIEMMHMIRKGQFSDIKEQALSHASASRFTWPHRLTAAGPFSHPRPYWLPGSLFASSCDQHHSRPLGCADIERHHSLATRRVGCALNQAIRKIC